jgi:hypothetical protein
MTAPRPPEGSNSQIVLSSPLAVLGMLVDVLRQRFKNYPINDPALRWVWDPDPKKTGIFVESGWNDNLEARNVRPGVWVERGQNVYTQSGIGRQDQVPVVLTQQKEYFHSFVETDIIIDCTAQNRGESMLLGSVVQDFLVASSNIIEAKFGLRHMSDSILNQTTPFEKDNTLWTSQITFRTYYEVRWITAPIEDVLNRLTMRIEDADKPEQHFVELVMHNSS